MRVSAACSSETFVHVGRPQRMLRRYITAPVETPQFPEFRCKGQPRVDLSLYHAAERNERPVCYAIFAQIHHFAPLRAGFALRSSKARGISGDPFLRSQEAEHGWLHLRA